MRKSRAIEILEEQKQIFIEKSYSDRDVWKQLVCSYISDFLGNDSNEYKTFSNFKFIEYFKHNSSESIAYELNKEIAEIIGMLENCIEKLKTGKLYRKPQSNILSRLTNERLLAIIFAISSVVFGIGYYFGTEKTNRDFIQTEIKYKNLRDSLSFVKPSVDTNSMTNEKK